MKNKLMYQILIQDKQNDDDIQIKYNQDKEQTNGTRITDISDIEMMSILMHNNNNNDEMDAANALNELFEEKIHTINHVKDKTINKSPQN